MFNFKAIAEDAAKTAQVVADNAATVVNKQEGKEMSNAATNAVKRGIVTGIVRSLVAYLFNTEADEKTQRAKTLTVVNAMLADGTIDAYESRWLINDYFPTLRCDQVASDKDACDAPMSSSYCGWWSIISNLLDDPQVGAWSFGCCGPDGASGEKNQLAPHEVELVESYRSIQESYWKARSAFEQYFREVVRKTLVSVLIKYATTFQQVAPTWYNDIARCAGVIKDTESESLCEAEG